MKKFIIRLAFFILLFFSITALEIIAAMVFCAPQYTHSYQASMLDKMARLESIKGPKIVLAGDSNVAFGFKSEMIEKAFNMPVVNLGLHGYMGKRFQENMAKYNMGKGDIIAICHSYTSPDTGAIRSPALVWITIENHLHLWPLIRYDVPQMIAAVFPYSLKVWRRRIKHKDKVELHTCYSREAFNQYGDNAYPRPKNEFIFHEGDVPIPYINEACINRLNRLNRYCTRRGATLVIAGYPIGYGEYTPDKTLLIKKWNYLKSNLDCDVISNIEDYFFPYSDFYDSDLHLVDSAAARRTEQFINDLKRLEITEDRRN